jgi:tRNA(Ile)-lysidine synthase
VAYAVKRQFERSIARALERIGVPHRAMIVVGLSGGPDSVALLHGLLAMRAGGRHYRLIAAHLNHRLRGAEADHDEAFVRALCGRNDVELEVEQADGLAGGGGNLEERARIIRHTFLNRTAERYGAGHIALAHHAGDQAETVLLRLMRGCGIAGAAGMAEAGPGRLIRPLLQLTRSDVLGYLDTIGEPYVTDSSNLALTNERSRIRRELIPLLERDYAPGFSRRLAGLADELRAGDDFITGHARDELKRRLSDVTGSLDVSGFADLHPALAVSLVREYLRSRWGDLRGVNRAHIKSMWTLCASGPVNGWCHLPGEWRMRREYDKAWIEQSPGQVQTAFELRLDGFKSGVRAGGLAFTLSRIDMNGALLANIGSRLGTGQMEALFDLGPAESSLIIRTFRPGDRIRPLGIDGSRKVHDLFIDRKLPRERRASWPLVAASGGEILWIPGMARSRFGLVTPATRTAVRLTAEVDPPNPNPALPRI